MILPILETLHRSGIPALARLVPQRRFLVLNFHRVHDAPTPFHEGVIEVGSREFRNHLHWLKKRVTFISEAELADLTSGGKLKVLLTFDDGYRDSYDVVAPILDELKIPAIFFVAPGMIDRRQLGSWDRIAYLVKKFPRQEFRFRDKLYSTKSGPLPVYSALSNESRNSLPDLPDEFVEELANTLGVQMPSTDLQGGELLTWDQVRHLRNHGFSIGCHSFSHRALASLALDEQEEEILLARARLESEGVRATSFAYPYGNPESFSWETRELAKKAGFKNIFSFNGYSLNTRNFHHDTLDRVSFKSTLSKYNFLISFPGLHNLLHFFQWVDVE